MTSISRIRAKWDAMAAPQLRAELEKMRIALDEAESRAKWAELRASESESMVDMWQDIAMDTPDLKLGLTMEGEIVKL